MLHHKQVGSFKIRCSAPGMIGKFNGPCIVLGSARGVWEDFEPIKDLGYAIMAINEIGLFLNQDLHHWFSFQSDWLEASLAYRIRYASSKKHPPWGHGFHGQWELNGVNAWQFQDQTVKDCRNQSRIENSGFIAMCLAVVLGYHPVILCGCPADLSGHIIKPPWQCRGVYGDQRGNLEKMVAAHPEIGESVRSMSGVTKDVLGAPAV